jgi:hypothetical protein
MASKHQKLWPTPIIYSLGVVLLLVLGYKMVVVPSTPPTAEIPKIISPTPLPPQPTPSPKPGYQVYANQMMGFGFAYPKSESLRASDNWPWDGGFDSYDLHIYSIDSSFFHNTAHPNLVIKDVLLGKDLFCQADGVLGYDHCRNNKIEDYRSANGAIGYKIYRSIEIGTQEKQNPALYSVVNRTDEVYVFPLPKVVAGPEKYSQDAAAILLFVSPDASAAHTPQANKLMDQLADSIFLL